LVIRGWGESDAALKFEGAAVPRGPNFRYGLRRALDGTNLIVWIRTVSEKPVRISISSANRNSPDTAPKS